MKTTVYGILFFPLVLIQAVQEKLAGFKKHQKTQDNEGQAPEHPEDFAVEGATIQALQTNLHEIRWG